MKLRSAYLLLPASGWQGAFLFVPGVITHQFGCDQRNKQSPGKITFHEQNYMFFFLKTKKDGVLGSQKESLIKGFSEEWESRVGRMGQATEMAGPL